MNEKILKNLCRVLASQANVPLVYVPLEAVGSRFYGESEKLLSEIFQAAEQLGPCLVFLDEIDALATSRGYVLRVWTLGFQTMTEETTPHDKIDALALLHPRLRN